jgi:hypothetical protein
VCNLGQVEDMSFENFDQKFIIAFGATQEFLYHSPTQRTTIVANVFNPNPIAGPPGKLVADLKAVHLSPAFL